MKKTAIFLMLAFGLMPAVVHSEIIDRVAAVVNDDVITQSEIDLMIRPFFEQMKSSYQGQELMEKLTEMRRTLLNQLIEDKLAYQESIRKKIEVSESDIDEKILDFKRRFKAEDEFNKIMTAQGMTMTKLRDRYRQQIAIRRLQNLEVRARVLVSPKEIEDYFAVHEKQFNQPERVKLRSITIRKAPEKQTKIDEDAKAKADQILADIKKGADFAKIAEAHSEDHNAASGGDLGLVGRGEMARVIDEVVFALKPGDLSPVIETDIGYHIFKVEERQEGKKRTLDECRAEIQEILFREKAKKRFDEWMKELKAKAYISIR
ncbi:MAG: peptidylprolyl isomerase [Candidatus Omnitrophica bacterium]|nr:peptidylprolyl isomerase [Candidatus Omnitrophota bacterium]